MSGDKNKKLILFFMLSVSLLTSSLTAVFVHHFDSRAQFRVLGDLCAGVMEAHSDCTQTILELLKAEKFGGAAAESENILLSFGYRQSDFGNGNFNLFLLAFAGFAIGGAIFLFAFWYWHQKSAARIRMLTDYLEKINTGGEGLLFEAAEDECSRLQDEIYKTVTMLSQTRDDALAAKRNFADNLSNIAHQLKTPITAISLSNQMMRERFSPSYSEQIRRQLQRLTYLEEALLLLSRIDAGTLVLERKSVDVFTLLTLASENLQELFAQAGISADIPEMGEVTIDVDLDWTMEAVMNLFKNCMEHTAGKTAVHCSYEKNPLYAQIQIWDEGEGFEKEDLPYLFDRFYRGKNAKDSGIGIGLSLAKEIIEMQNGTIRACNLPDGGACFELRFYSH